LRFFNCESSRKIAMGKPYSQDLPERVMAVADSGLGGTFCGPRHHPEEGASAPVPKGA